MEDFLLLLYYAAHHKLPCYFVFQFLQPFRHPQYFLLVLERNKLLRHHTVGTVVVKEDLRRGWDGWPHYAAIVVDSLSKQRYAVDGWKLASGKEPEIVEAEKWYIDDADIALRTTL